MIFTTLIVNSCKRLCLRSKHLRLRHFIESRPFFLKFSVISVYSQAIGLPGTKRSMTATRFNAPGVNVRELWSQDLRSGSVVFLNILNKQ